MKIDNVPLARPHYGITQADMVFEILVEGFATRLGAVFHSEDPQTIGNVRSARLADRSLTPMVRGALVYSGTSAYEVPLIQGDATSGKYVDLSADYTSGYYRVTFRPGPYNMFTSAAAMRQAIAARGADKPQQIPTWGFLAYTDHVATIAGMSGGAGHAGRSLPEDISREVPGPPALTYRGSEHSGKAARRRWVTISRSRRRTSRYPHEIWEFPRNRRRRRRDSTHAPPGTGAATIFRDGLRRMARGRARRHARLSRISWRETSDQGQTVHSYRTLEIRIS